MFEFRDQMLTYDFGAKIQTYERMNTLVKSSRINTGKYTFPILLLNHDSMLGEHKGKEKNIVYGRLF